MTTIRDIARKAGVSVSTASLALNNDERVKADTRQRVLTVARDLDYHPLRAAKSLSSGRSWSIQLINPVGDAALSSGFFTRFARGIHDLAFEQHYTVALSILESEAEARTVVARLVRERWVDGLILMNPSEGDALLADLVANRFPHVLLGRSPLAGVSSVDNDNHGVAFDATMHLLKRRCHPVLFLNGPRQHTFTHDRAEGYREAYRQAGLPLSADLLLFGEGSADAARREIAGILEAGVTFRSLVAVSDAQAIGAMRALQERGLRIPEEVAIIGMNNDDLTDFTFPRLSSVELNAYDLGRSAAELLLQTIAGTLTAPARRIVPHRLVLRESSP